MTRFAIVTDSSIVSADVRNALTAFLEAKGWEVWHWFPDLWLVDPSEEVALMGLRAEIQSVLPALRRIFIVATEGELNHSAMVPASSVDWLKRHWRKRPG